MCNKFSLRSVVTVMVYTLSSTTQAFPCSRVGAGTREGGRGGGGVYNNKDAAVTRISITCDECGHELKRVLT
jgi:hypothetical protein